MFARLKGLLRLTSPGRLIRRVRSSGPRTSFPVVLRFKSVQPHNLGKIQAHAERSLGDLENINPAARGHAVQDVNEVMEGGAGWGWVDRTRAAIASAAEENLAARIEHLEGSGNRSEANRLRRSDPPDPYRVSSAGPIREAILTVDAEWFASQSAHDRLSNGDRTKAFKEAGAAFFRENFPGQLVHLRLDLDEAAPHFHAVLVPWVETKTRAGVSQKRIEPFRHPLLKDYEAAQDAAGAHFAPIGLVRGERRKEAWRLAKEAGIEAPPKRFHTTPRAYRSELRAAELGLEGFADQMAERSMDLADRSASLSIEAKAVARDAARVGVAVSEATTRAAQQVLARAQEAERAKTEAAKNKGDQAKADAKREAIKRAAMKAQAQKPRPASSPAPSPAPRPARPRVEPAAPVVSPVSAPPRRRPPSSLRDDER